MASAKAVFTRGLVFYGARHWVFEVLLHGVEVWAGINSCLLGGRTEVEARNPDIFTVATWVAASVLLGQLWFTPTQTGGTFE